MAELRVSGDELVCHLVWWERAATRRGDVRVPLAAVEGITVLSEPWRALRGVRERGLLIPGALCLGVWRHPDGRDFVAVRSRHSTVVRVDLRRPSRLARITASTADPEQAVAALRPGHRAADPGSRGARRAGRRGAARGLRGYGVRPSRSAG